ncbi:trehalose-phosphatase [uncultured Microbacterium sp.]|uniref:trehalose-phosphatase n=1 Tax=uncultured Microbacterium sp. TaxID=191216 RepID=UPI0026121022|nr:trehalose-phosphatase [uncultured Microbacterium sp.]
MTRRWTAATPDTAVTAIARTTVLLVALDFDGTASPLVPDPMQARALPSVTAAVARLALLPDTEVAYVSGRSLVHLREIAEHDDDSPVILAGSHGAQYWFPGEGEADAGETAQERELRESLFDELEPLLEQYPGVELERKTFGVGVLGRPADPAVERAAFSAVDEVMARRAARWRRRTGDRILEFSSRQEGKDAAIRTLRDRTGATGILFAGDDVTDEDALRVLEDGDLGVRVGEGETSATLRVDSPQQIAELLDVIAAERATGRE